MKKKKKNPQDATLRNIRALKKRVSDLKGKVDRLEFILIYHQNLIRKLQLLISKGAKGR